MEYTYFDDIPNANATPEIRTKYHEYLNCIAMRKIQQFHIVDVLKQNVEGIK